MDSMLDSLAWVERLSPRRTARRSRKTWLRRMLILLVMSLGAVAASRWFLG